MTAWRMTLGAALCLAFAGGASAQRLGDPPKRPRGTQVADSNDARAWADMGLAQLTRNPQAAADAYYWAARLDPTSGDHVYGLAMATVARSQSLLRTYMRYRRSSTSRDIMRVDSLVWRAHVMDPFLFRRHDYPLFMEYVAGAARTGRVDDPGRVELEYAVTQYLNSTDADTRAWMAYSMGNFQRALGLYAEALKASREKSSILVDRGRIFGRLGQVDSANTQFTLALEELRKRDARDLVVVYYSKAVIEHSIATLLEQKGDVAAAREAYGRALQEDLSYYPAHTRLGLLALATGDTTTAVAELELAAQLAPDDAYPRFMLASTLAASGKLDEAVAAYRKVVELEPWWATPWAGLAMLLERKGDGPQALEAYNGFFARAARTNPLAPEMTRRRSVVKEFLGIKP